MFTPLTAPFPMRNWRPLLPPITAENMLNRANVQKVIRVLIPGASGGVGSALIQLANRRGATTIAMASRSKHDAVAGFDPHAILGARRTI